MVRVTEAIKNIAVYQPGKPIEEVKRELGLKDVIKLASNENPLGVSPKALAAIKEQAGKLNRYPEGTCFKLRQRLSKKLNITAGNLLFGNGSDEIIDIIIKTFCRPDEEIITADKTFLEYKIIALQNSRLVRTVALKNLRYDLKEIKRNINTKTKIVFIANPNNPTGTYVKESEIEEFLSGLPQDIIVVLDEAYFEFVEAPDYPVSIDLLKKSPNIIILRTFSKIYGLAGLRIGYAVADKEIIRYLERARQPFNVNSLAQAAAFAALNDTDFITKTIKSTKEGKKYIYEELTKLNIEYIPSETNFVLINLKKDGRDVFQKMLKKGIIIRELKQYNLDNFIRVTIGTMPENRKFIKALRKI